MDDVTRIGLTDEQIAEAVWGTGYGGRRHLVDPANIGREWVGARTYRMVPRALCTTTISLDFLDSAGSDQVSDGLKPCLKCLAKAEREGLMKDACEGAVR